MQTDYISQVLTNIKALNPFQVLLFGSYATGTQTEDSDIDLVVVLDKEDVPKSYKESTDNYLTVKRLLREINRNIPMDVIVCTKPQWNEFLLSESSFSKELAEKGKIIYERHV